MTQSPRFTKKHYEFLANFLRRELELAKYPLDEINRVRAATIESLTRLLALQLANDNERFDRDKFLAASGQKVGR